MGAVLIAGGVLGSLLGGLIFRLLQQSGQIDTVVSILYVILLGTIGFMMAKEAATALNILKPSPRAAERPTRRHNPLIAMLPMRWRSPICCISRQPIHRTSRMSRKPRLNTGWQCLRLRLPITRILRFRGSILTGPGRIIRWIPCRSYRRSIPALNCIL